jgi:hypothetical protein
MRKIGKKVGTRPLRFARRSERWLSLSCSPTEASSPSSIGCAATPAKTTDDRVQGEKRRRKRKCRGRSFVTVLPACRTPPDDGAAVSLTPKRRLSMRRRRWLRRVCSLPLFPSLPLLDLSSSIFLLPSLLALFLCLPSQHTSSSLPPLLRADYPFFPFPSLFLCNSLLSSRSP